jgi:hypothetical protein
MNRIVRTVLITAAIAVFTFPGFAQSGVVRANIPFGFTVADKTMPAGDYLITCDLSNEMLSMENKNGGRTTLQLANLIEDRAGLGTAKLVFTESGGHYFLSQVWSGDGFEYQLHPGRLETGLVKHANGKHANGTQVIIAAK